MQLFILQIEFLKTFSLINSIKSGGLSRGCLHKPIAQESPLSSLIPSPLQPNISVFLFYIQTLPQIH